MKLKANFHDFITLLLLFSFSTFAELTDRKGIIISPGSSAIAVAILDMIFNITHMPVRNKNLLLFGLDNKEMQLVENPKKVMIDFYKEVTLFLLIVNSVNYILINSIYT